MTKKKIKGFKVENKQELSKVEQDILDMMSHVAVLGEELEVLAKYIEINMQIVLSIARASGVTPQQLADNLMQKDENKKFNIEANEIVKKYEAEIAKKLEEMKTKEERLKARKERVKRTTKK